MQDSTGQDLLKNVLDPDPATRLSAFTFVIRTVEKYPGRPFCSLDVYDNFESVSSVYKVLEENPGFADLIVRAARMILEAKTVVVWDSESDESIGKNAHQAVREWVLVKLNTNQRLWIKRNDPGYDAVAAAKSVAEFLKDADLVVGYEPNKCDQKRLINVSFMVYSFKNVSQGVRQVVSQLAIKRRRYGFRFYPWISSLFSFTR